MEQEASVLRQDARLEAEDAEEEAALGRLRRLRMGERLVQLRRGKLVRLQCVTPRAGVGSFRACYVGLRRLRMGQRLVAAAQGQAGEGSWGACTSALGQICSW